MEVYDNCSASPITCATTSLIYPNFGMAQLYRTDTIAETLYVRVTSDGDIPGKFLICASDDSLINSVSYSLPGKITPEIYSSNKSLIIESNDLKNAGTYEIYNMQGMKIKKGSLTDGRNEIRCDELPDGVYLVNVMGGGRFGKRVMLME
jgi:hypothetical protein